jgi:YggT family protein
VRKITEKWVYPAARFFAMYGVSTKLAPLLTMFIGFILTFFAMQIVGNTFFIIDGLTAGVVLGRPKVIIGFVIYALLSVLVLFIFIRFLASWFVFTRKTFLGFVTKVTDPIMLPVQRLVPPFGMFDISAMLVLLAITFLQSIVLSIFVRN